MGILQVGNSDTVTTPIDTIPVAGIGAYEPVKYMKPAVPMVPVGSCCFCMDTVHH